MADADIAVVNDAKQKHDSWNDQPLISYRTSDPKMRKHWLRDEWCHALIRKGATSTGPAALAGFTMNNWEKIQDVSARIFNFEGPEDKRIANIVTNDSPQDSDFVIFIRVDAKQMGTSNRWEREKWFENLVNGTNKCHTVKELKALIVGVVWDLGDGRDIPEDYMEVQKKTMTDICDWWTDKASSTWDETPCMVACLDEHFEVHNPYDKNSGYDIKFDVFGNDDHVKKAGIPVVITNRSHGTLQMVDALRRDKLERERYYRDKLERGTYDNWKKKKENEENEPKGDVIPAGVTGFKATYVKATLRGTPSLHMREGTILAGPELDDKDIKMEKIRRCQEPDLKGSPYGKTEWKMDLAFRSEEEIVELQYEGGEGNPITDKIVISATLDFSNQRNLGVSLGNARSKSEGILINKVDPLGQAHGILLAGDQVVAINGKSSVGMVVQEIGGWPYCVSAANGSGLMKLRTPAELTIVRSVQSTDQDLLLFWTFLLKPFEHQTTITPAKANQDDFWEAMRDASCTATTARRESGPALIGHNVAVWEYEPNQKHKGLTQFEALCNDCSRMLVQMAHAQLNLEESSLDVERQKEQSRQGVYVVIIVVDSAKRDGIWEDDSNAEYPLLTPHKFTPEKVKQIEKQRKDTFGNEVAPLKLMTIYADKQNGAVNEWHAKLKGASKEGIGLQSHFRKITPEYSRENTTESSQEEQTSLRNRLCCLKAAPPKTNFAVVLNHLTLPRMENWIVGGKTTSKSDEKRLAKSIIRRIAIAQAKGAVCVVLPVPFKAYCNAIEDKSPELKSFLFEPLDKFGPPSFLSRWGAKLPLCGGMRGENRPVITIPTVISLDKGQTSDSGVTGFGTNKLCLEYVVTNEVLKAPGKESYKLNASKTVAQAVTARFDEEVDAIETRKWHTPKFPYVSNTALDQELAALGYDYVGKLLDVQQIKESVEAVEAKRLLDGADTKVLDTEQAGLEQEFEAYFEQIRQNSLNFANSLPSFVAPDIEKFEGVFKQWCRCAFNRAFVQ